MTRTRLQPHALEVRELCELVEPLLDLRGRQLAQPIDRELLDREAPHHAAHDHRGADRRRRQIARIGQVAHQAPGEAVPRAGRILDLGERHRGRREHPAAIKQQGAGVAALDDQGRRPHLEDLARRAPQVVLLGELAGLLVVDHQRPDLRERLHQVVALDVDPQVHRVGGDQHRGADLAEHVELEHRIDVAEQHQLCVLVRLVQLGLEVGEHAEPGVEGLAGRQVRGVAADPVERLAGRALDPGDVDADPGELVDVAPRKVIADHPDDRDALGEIGRGAGDERRRAAEQISVEPEGAVDVIERDRANDKQGTMSAACVHE